MSTRWYCCGDWITLIQHSKYHGYWCTGSLCRQDISNHDIDYVEYVGPCLMWRSISNICVMSMWRSDIKSEYNICFVPYKNFARKGLSPTSTISIFYSILFHLWYSYNTPSAFPFFLKQNSWGFAFYIVTLKNKTKIAMILTFSSLVAVQVVSKPMSGATSDDKVGIMTTRSFHGTVLSSISKDYMNWFLIPWIGLVAYIFCFGVSWLWIIEVSHWESLACNHWGNIVIKGRTSEVCQIKLWYIKRIPGN